MPAGDAWTSIIGAVKSSLGLAALIVLVLAFILRIALSKVPQLRKQDGYRALLYVVSVIGFIALVIVVGVLCLELLHNWNEGKKTLLGRLEFENTIQKHRGGIERCLSNRSGVLFIDFVVRYNAHDGFDIDIYPGDRVAEKRSLADKAGVFEKLPGDEVRCEFLLKKITESQDIYFVSSSIGFHPAAITIGRRSSKLSITAPDINRCILELLAPELEKYRQEEGGVYTHRMITDIGVSLSK